MAIDVNAAADEYRARASGAGDKLVRKYVAQTDKLARSQSDAAEQNYAAGVQDAAARKLRQKGLKRLSESDLNAAMQAKGSANYANGVQAGADKYQNRVAPYLSELDTITKNLKGRTRDPAANVLNRVTPIAVGLRKKKDSMG